ncbi:MAG TPA: tetratricopeptide repeat protein [Planctomycetota bacterium]|jgi:tetratricopeptide (TPR) repeat protein
MQSTRNLLLVSGCLLLLAGCLDIEQARNSLPFMPPSKYVVVGGRRLTRAEVAYYQKIKDLSVATKVNPRDAVAYNAIGELFQKKGNYQLSKDLYYKALDIDDTLSEAHHNLAIICMNEMRLSEAADHLTKAKKLSPDDARIRFHLAQSKILLGKLDEGVREFDEAIALDSEFTPAYLEKAKLYYSLRRYAEATGICRTALTNVPKTAVTVAKTTRGNRVLDKLYPTGQELDEAPTWRAEAAYDLALCLKAQGQLNEALRTLLIAEEAQNGKMDVQLLKARLQESLNDNTGAVATLSLLKTGFPESAEVLKRLSKIYQKTNQTQLAAKTRLEAAELDHSDRDLQEEAAHAAEGMKDGARAIAIYERLVRIDPEDIRYRRQLARSYDSAGIQRQAALAYQEIVNRMPEDHATRRRLGMLMADLPGFQGRAILQFQQVLQNNPRDAEVNRRMGELYLQSRNFTEAEKYIRQTLQYSPNDPLAHQNLATLYIGQTRFEDGIGEYKKALALDPKLDVARLNLAKVLAGMGRKEEAILPLREYLGAKPLDEEALRLLAGSLRDLGRREEAIKEYEAITALKATDIDANMQLAVLQKDLGKTRAAAGIYESILERAPSNLEALREAGRLYVDLDMPLRAVFCWQRVLGLKPGDPEGQRRLAEVYKKIGAEDAALASYENLAKSGDADAWKRLATLHLQRNEKEKACQDYREAIKIKAQDLESRRALTQLLQEIAVAPASSKDAGTTPAGRDASATPAEAHEEAVKEAIALYQDIMQLDPTDIASRLNLANLLSESNRLAEAQEMYDAILEARPKHPGALIGMGVIWRKRGRYEKALDSYHLALEKEAEWKKTPPAEPSAADGDLKAKWRIAHFNIALIYDFYLYDRVKAQLHYDRFIELGGNPNKLPEDTRPPGARPKVTAAQNPGSTMKETSAK